MKSGERSDFLDRATREIRDAEIIDANADRVNDEARDVLEYQGPCARSKRKQ